MSKGSLVVLWSRHRRRHRQPQQVLMFRPPLWPQICLVLHDLVEAEVQVPIPVGIILARNMFPRPPPLPLQLSLKSPGWQRGPGPP